jgi:hypothetical protein
MNFSSSDGSAMIRLPAFFSVENREKSKYHFILLFSPGQICSASYNSNASCVIIFTNQIQRLRDKYAGI